MDNCELVFYLKGLFIFFAAVDRFPILERDREIASNSIERTRVSVSTASSSSKSQEHNHNREVIFALPSLQLHFKTEHRQGASTPEPIGRYLRLSLFDLS